MAGIRIDRLNKKFGAFTAVESLDLDVAHGEFVVLLGPSGCGKTTTLNCIAGLEQPTQGRILFDGRDVTSEPPHSRNIAMVFQSALLYPHMNARQNIEASLRRSGLDKAEQRKRIDEAAQMLEIEDLLDKLPSSMSGGQRQRVATAKAIVRQPTAFLLDEPLSALDAALRMTLRAEIVNLQKRLETTTIFVTHDQVEAMTMADRIVVLRLGYIEQVGAPLDLYNRPANRFVAGFIGSPRMNFLEGRIAAIEDNAVSVEIPGLPPIKAAADGAGCTLGAPITLGIRPEHIAIVEKRDNTPSALVNTTEQLGSDSYLYCQMPEGQWLTIHHPGQTSIRQQEHIAVLFDPRACHLFKKDEAGAALPRTAPMIDQAVETAHAASQA